jgi:hypothetical protein
MSPTRTPFVMNEPDVAVSALVVIAIVIVANPTVVDVAHVARIAASWNMSVCPPTDSSELNEPSTVL